MAGHWKRKTSAREGLLKGRGGGRGVVVIMRSKVHSQTIKHWSVQAESPLELNARYLTKHLLSVHDLVLAEFASGQSSNAVNQNQLDVVINNASF